MKGQAPRQIRWFEAAQFTSVAIGLVHQLALPAMSSFDLAFEVIYILSLTLLISRGRQNWARWVLAASFALGLALMIYAAPSILENGLSPLSVVALLLQAVGIGLVFSRPSSRWMRRPPSRLVRD
jgi:hypothetical protein